MDSFVQCYYCKKNLTNPLELVCRHSYCSDCLTKEIQNDKIICPICGTEHSAPAASLSSAKQDKLAPYIIGLDSGAPYSIITDDSPPTIQAECAGCKKTTDLRVCYHCEKPLCTDCRTKHYESQKKDVDQSIQSLSHKTIELITLAQTLNNNRNGQIQGYKIMKEQISSHAKDLIKKIHDEEQEFHKTIDETIQYETQKIAVTEQEEKYLQKNKAALAEIADKYRDETNQMVLLKMHKDYLGSASDWKAKLEANSGRFNAKKDEELNFHPNNTGKHEHIIGDLVDSKNVKPHKSSGGKRTHNDQKESRSCTIM